MLEGYRLAHESLDGRELTGAAGAPGVGVALHLRGGRSKLVRELQLEPAPGDVVPVAEAARVHHEGDAARGVGGDSLQPLLSERDTLLVRLGPRLVSGTLVVAYRPDHGYVVKQVGKVTQRIVVLDSLNPAYEPIRLQRRRGTILGTVVACWHPRNDAPSR